MSRSKSKLGPFLKGSLRIAVTTLVLLEIVLQVAALIAWITLSRPDTAPAGSAYRTVLCLGDSFTYGLGASSQDGSYPAQFENLLQERAGPEWRVANYGWPGRNSREILERLPAQLEELQPALVYLIVGINDLWSHPAQLDLALHGQAPRIGSGFRLVWRTGRLLAWLLGERTSSEKAVKQPRGDGVAPRDERVSIPWVDRTWLFSGRPLAFLRDGTAYLGKMELSWSAEGERLRLGSPGSNGLELTWRMEGDKLVLSKPDWPAPRVLDVLDVELPSRARPAVPQETENGWELIRRGDLAGAEAVFRGSIEHAQDGDPTARAALHGLLLRMGEFEQAREQAHWIEQQYSDPKRRTQAVAEAWAEVLDALQDSSFPDVLRSSLEQFPQSDQLWSRQAWLLYQSGRIDEARQAVQMSSSLAQANGRWPPLIIEARIECDDNPQLAARNVITYHRLTRDHAQTVQNFQMTGQKCTQEALERTLDELDASAQERAEIQRLFAEAFGDTQPALATYRAHLQQIAQLCRIKGAELVLSSYPWQDLRLDPVMQSVARDAGAGFLDMAGQFERRLQGRERAQYFARDGHCNDSGYAVMAAIMAEDALARIRAR